MSTPAQYLVDCLERQIQRARGDDYGNGVVPRHAMEFLVGRAIQRLAEIALLEDEAVQEQEAKP